MQFTNCSAYQPALCKSRKTQLTQAHVTPLVLGSGGVLGAPSIFYSFGLWFPGSAESQSPTRWGRTT